MELTNELRAWLRMRNTEYEKEYYRFERFFEQENVCPVVGIDLHDGFCYAVRAAHDEDGNIVTTPLEWWNGEEYITARQPVVLAFDRNDPEGAYIGMEAEQYAARTGAALYRDFLRVPDERALAAYHGDPTQPSYLRLTELYFRWLMAETTENAFLVTVPDTPEWAGKAELLEELLQKQCRYWEHDHVRYAMENGEQPDPMDRYFALVLPRAQALQNGLYTGVCTPEDSFAAGRGVAVTGYLLWYRQALLYYTGKMLYEAFPHADERLRDVLCDEIAEMLLQRLDRRMNAWAESGYASRTLHNALWGRSYSPGNAESAAISAKLRQIVAQLLPARGSDPAQDPGAVSGFPPTYLGPCVRYGNDNFYVALTARTEEYFLDRFPAWQRNKDMSGPFDYAQFSDELAKSAVQPLYAAFGDAPFGNAAMFGMVGAMSLGLSGGENSKEISSADRKRLLQQYQSHRQNLKRELGRRIYEDAPVWQVMAQAVFGAIYESQQRLLDDRLRFLQPEAQPARLQIFEEGWLE